MASSSRVSQSQSGLEIQRTFFDFLDPQQSLHLLFDYLPHTYLFVKNLEHRFTKANRALVHLLGRKSESEILGKTDFDFHSPALASQYVEEDNRVMREERSLVDQVWLVLGADGMPQWYLSTKIPLKDRSGRVIGIGGVMRPYDLAGDTSGEYGRLTRACEYALAHYSERVTIADLAKRAHLSPSHLQREFLRLFGVSPSEYLLRVRLLMGRRRLEQTNEPIGKIALECGFYDQSHFSRAFRQDTGLPPKAYRKRFGARSQPIQTARP